MRRGRIGLLLLIPATIGSVAYILSDSGEEASIFPSSPNTLEAPASQRAPAVHDGSAVIEVEAAAPGSASTPDDASSSGSEPIERNNSRSGAPQDSESEIIGVPLFANVGESGSAASASTAGAAATSAAASYGTDGVIRLAGIGGAGGQRSTAGHFPSMDVPSEDFSSDHSSGSPSGSAGGAGSGGGSSVGESTKGGTAGQPGSSQPGSNEGTNDGVVYQPSKEHGVNGDNNNYTGDNSNDNNNYIGDNNNSDDSGNGSLGDGDLWDSPPPLLGPAHDEHDEFAKHDPTNEPVNVPEPGSLGLLLVGLLGYAATRRRR